MEHYEHYQAALEEITDHWDSYLASESYAFPRKGSITCLGDLSSWLSELLKRGCPTSIFIDNDKLSLSEIYPSILAEGSTKLIAKELQVILPDAPEVCAILPVLITGYIVNRRGRYESEKGIPSGATALYRKLYYKYDISNQKSSSKSLFQVCEWKERYPDVTYGQMTKSIMKGRLSYFGMVNLFLFLAYKMEGLCNLTLSCALFEEFTGYPGLCDKFFPRLEVETELHTEDDPLKEKISLYLAELYKDYTPDSVDTSSDADEPFISTDSTSEVEDYLSDIMADTLSEIKELDGKIDFLLETLGLDSTINILLKIKEERNSTTSNFSEETECDAFSDKVELDRKIDDLLKMKDPTSDGKIGTALDLALDRYIIFFVSALIHRDKVPESDLSKSPWANEVWENPMLRFFLNEPFDRARKGNFQNDIFV